MNEPHIIIVFLAGTAIITGFAVTLTLFLIINKQRQNRSSLLAQQMAHQYSQALLETRIEVQEQSLKLVAQEIHDNVGQSLSLACLTLLRLKKHIDAEGEAVLSENIELIRNAVKDLRSLSHSLHYELIEKNDLEDLVRAEMKRLHSPGEMTCEFRTEGENYDVSPEKKLLVFRIIQEALHNIIRHAAADHIRIVLVYGLAELSISIADNGTGFDTALLDSSKSLGVANMRARVAMMNGAISIQSSTGNGTFVRISIPINPPI